MRPDVRFVYQQEIFFVESPEVSSHHSHNWPSFGWCSNTLRTRFQVCRYVYTQVFFFCYLLYNITVTVIISYVILCTCIVTNMHDFASHLLSLCNFLILSYQSYISIVLHLRPVILNHSLSSSMTAVLFSPLLQPHPMNLSSPVTLTFISIILHRHSHLSVSVSSLFFQS